MIATISCQKYFNEEKQTEETGLSEKTIETGDAIGKTVETATPATKALINLAPEPIASIGRIIIEALGGVLVLWQTIRNLRLTSGARKTATVLAATVKSTNTWDTVGPALAAAATDYVLVKPIMADKA